MSDNTGKIIGRASATEKVPNQSNEFSFWLAPEILVNPFDIVEAESYKSSKTYGLVMNLEHATDANTHLSNFISNNFGEATEDPQTPRQGTTVASCNVMSNTEEIYMPVPSEARVRFADPAGILKALGADAIKEENKVPAGLIEMSNGTKAPCFLDARYLLGPEGAHMNISGIDLNPLAVIAARTNYLLALGPLLKTRGAEPLEIPVYLADSVMTPSRKDHDLFEKEKVRVWLSIGKVEIPRRLANQDGVTTLTHLLDLHLEKSPSTKPEDFAKHAKAPLLPCYDEQELKDKGLTPQKAWEQDAELIQALYTTLHELHSKGRNGLWARVLKNAFAPIFLAPFDYVAGNPPWINWQNLPEGYRKETKDLWFQHGLFVHSGMDTILGKGKKDISTLVTYVAAESYLKDGGKLGFVITQAVFKTSGAGQGFRKFKTRRGKPLGIVWVDDFSEMQLFEGATNRTAVFVMRKGQAMKYPVSYAYWRKKESGRKGGFDYDTTLQEAIDKTQRFSFVAEPVDGKDITSAWITGRPAAIKAVRKVLGKSDYEAHAGVYTGGANAVYWFDILADHGDGTVTARNVTEGAKRKIESVQVKLEKELLYPMLRGRDLARWSAVPTSSLLFVQDVERRCGIRESVMQEKYPLAYAWLSQQKATLLKRSSQSIKNLMKKHAFYSMFAVGDYTMSPWKVVWSEQATELQAAVVGKHNGKVILPDHKVMLVPCQSQDEAFYVLGVINSSLFRYGVGSYAIGIQMDTHLVDNIRVPRFDPTSKLHAEIGAEAKRLSSGDPESSEQIYPKLDALSKDLWGVTAQELKAVEASYRELFVTAAKDSNPDELKEDSPEYVAEAEASV